MNSKQARLIYRVEALDPTLNNLPTLAHILAFARLLVAADDWGRFSGDATIWQSQLFPRQPHITAEMMLAIQHDFAAAGFVGFYGAQGLRGAEGYCVIFRFARYQNPRSDRLRLPMYPVPPEQMWPLIAHPRNEGRVYDVPDIPYARWNEVRQQAQTQSQQIAWLPSLTRPAIEFYSDAEHPFGGVRLATETQRVELAVVEPPAQVSHPVQEMLLSTEDTVDKCLRVLHGIHNYRPKRPEDIRLIQDLMTNFTMADPLETCKGFATYIGDNPFPARGRYSERQALRNWWRIEDERARRRPGANVQSTTRNDAPREGVML